jgi:hypothetical protein
MLTNDEFLPIFRALLIFVLCPLTYLLFLSCFVRIPKAPGRRSASA